MRQAPDRPPVAREADATVGHDKEASPGFTPTWGAWPRQTRAAASSLRCEVRLSAATSLYGFTGSAAERMLRCRGRRRISPVCHRS